MTACIHKSLAKLSDLPYKPFASFQEGWRYYKCQECGAIIKGMETCAHVRTA